MALYADVRLVTASAKYGSRKIKSKRRNGGTQALREEAAKSGAWARFARRVPQSLASHWPHDYVVNGCAGHTLN